MLLFHKISKVILAIISFGLTGIAAKGIYDILDSVFLGPYTNYTTIKYGAITLTFLILITGILTTSYHIQSFSLFNFKRKINKVQSILWIGTYGFGITHVLFSFYLFAIPGNSANVFGYGLLTIALFVTLEVRATKRMYDEVIRVNESDLDEIGNS